MEGIFVACDCTVDEV